jgi:uncharacterized membrane protein YkvA (DUF1232 family)
MAQDNEQTVRNGFWPKLQQNLARIPFAGEVLAAWYCATDAATPLKVKATLFAALAYFILPFDVIPDVILGLGFTDDLAVLMTAMTLVKSHITQAHRDKARDAIARLRSGTTSTVTAE